MLCIRTITAQQAFNNIFEATYYSQHPLVGIMGRNKNRNKGKKHNGSITPHGQRTPGKRGDSSAILSVEDKSTTSSGKSTPIEQARDASPAPRTPNDQASIDQNQSPTPNQKRDSVISNTWDDSTKKDASASKPTIRSRWRLRPGRWWPCRACRWARNFGVAVIRGLQGPCALDFVLTLGLAFSVMFAGYVGVELVLGLLRGVEAQGMISSADCSVVYVTVPGPIITVSLIAASPSNPARGTYYFSVVNGTTEWMNSIAPPSRFSTLITKTPEATPVISSLPAIPPPSSTQSNRSPPPGVPPPAPAPAPAPPLVATTFTTTSLLGTSLVTTTITSRLPGNVPQASTTSSRGPFGEPLRPWPAPVVPTSSSIPGPLPVAPTPSNSIPRPPVSPPGAPNPITSSSSSMFSSSLGPQVPSTLAPTAAPVTSSISIVVTSTLPGGQTTNQTLLECCNSANNLECSHCDNEFAFRRGDHDPYQHVYNHPECIIWGTASVTVFVECSYNNAQHIFWVDHKNYNHRAHHSDADIRCSSTASRTACNFESIVYDHKYNSGWSYHHLNKHIGGGYQPVESSSSAEPNSSINIKRSGHPHKHNTWWTSYHNHFTERVISSLEPHTKRWFHGLATEPLL
ncbi:hypothetical protein FB567DRAFT_589303 [Paraphoma chrysanthemicola]|uniref:Uncharacterized protein n=1 Tax=Paraphoma chrysanthemicola TaxID=798071 RepID=A0A8K0W1A5_9PLEO|nr:hypothetical protein FB567DRAFT_589303 [Paraphoma chrysanthemicola]